MAKKLNKKVVIIVVILLLLVFGVGFGLIFQEKIVNRIGFLQNPDKSLEKAHQLLEAGDYENAEKEFGRAYSFGKTDAYKIDRLFDMAEFHLINNDLHEADWKMARGCWSKIVSIDASNIEAREKLLDFLYQAAEAGNSRLWKAINESTTEILDTLKESGNEPDASLLTKHAKSLLLMAERGETTNREELLAESFDVLDALIEKYPENEELYLLRAQCEILQGKINQATGIRDAEKNAMDNAMEWLETGIERSDNKATATANLMTFKLRTTANDPNSVEKLRAELETRAAGLTPNDNLYICTSVLYETTGKMSPEAELNRSIEAIRQACELEPEHAEYAIRMFRLLYRKGSAFNDPDATTDAIQLAEKTLLQPGTQDVPGPLQNRNRSYRFLTNSFLAEVYLEKAYQANNIEDEESAGNWIQKTEPRVKEISDYIGSAENAVVQKFEGMLALAKGEHNKAVRLMYNAYEQSKALDKEQTQGMNLSRSSIDPILCVTLANLMKANGQLGMQREFLEKAIVNNSPIVTQKPTLRLDYAEIVAKLGAWPTVVQMVNNYESRYGSTLKTQTLKAKAFIAMNQFDEAQQVISEIPTTESVTISLKIQLLTSQINGIRSSLAQQEAEEQAPSGEQTDELTRLSEERNQLIRQLLDMDTQTVDVQILIAVCNNLIKNERTQEAVDLIDKYLLREPDNLALKVLKLQTMEEDPLTTSRERQTELRQEAINTLSDPLKRNLALSQMYRQQGDYENALKALDAIGQEQSENNSSVLLEKFEIALQQKNVEMAEALLSPLRRQNLDNCEGNLFSGQVEFLKENYSLALRRLDECLTILPLSSQIYYLKSNVYNQQEDYEAAIESLGMATKMNPLNPIYARSMASALFSRNTKLASKVTPQQQEEAKLAIQRAMLLNPADWQLQSVYAETISDTQPDLALKMRQSLLKSYPTGTNALMLGNMALRMARSEWDAAKKTGLIELSGSAFAQAVEIEPDNEIAKQSYADYLRTTGKSEQVTDFFGDDENLLWKYYLRNSQFEQALEIQNKLFNESPEDITLLRGLVLTMEGMGNREQVKHYLGLLAELDDDKDSQLWVLQKYLDNGFALEAEEKLARLKERYPDEKLVLLIEAWTQMGKGELDEALSLTNRYLEIDTENSGAWRLRGRLYRLMNQPEKAISDLQRSKRIVPNPMTRLELASVYNEMSNPQGAIGELKEGLNDPQSPLQLRTMLEAIYKKTENFTELENFYNSTLEKYPQSHFWRLHAGTFHLEQENFKKAQQLLLDSWNLSVQQGRPDGGVLVTYLESLYKDNQYDPLFAFASTFIDSPAAPVAYAYMGQVQFRLNQQDEAKDSFYKALQKAESDNMQELALEKMLATMGSEAVESWYNQQLSQDPKSTAAHLLAYRLTTMQGRYNEAIEHLDHCIEILDKEHPGWISFATKKSNVLISAYLKTGDGDYLNRAIVLFESILEKRPENPTLLNNLAYLLIDNDQKIDTALTYALKAHQSNPGNSVFLDTYAYGLCKTGQYAEARRNLLRAIQINEASQIPIPWDMHKHLGMAYEGQSNYKQALEAYQKALEVSTDALEKDRQQLQEKINELSQ